MLVSSVQATICLRMKPQRWQQANYCGQQLADDRGSYGAGLLLGCSCLGSKLYFGGDHPCLDHHCGQQLADDRGSYGAAGGIVTDVEASVQATIVYG